MRQAHLICLREQNQEVLEAIRKTWPDDENRVELNDTAILVAHRNGGSSVYMLIQDALEEGESFKALVVRVGKAHHGYENRSLWAWLEQNTAICRQRSGRDQRRERLRARRSACLNSTSTLWGAFGGLVRRATST